MEWTEIERTYLTESWESNLEKNIFLHAILFKNCKQNYIRQSIAI